MKPFDDSTVTLDCFITCRSASLFDLLIENGKQIVQEGFLRKDPQHWPEDETFVALADRARNLAVVNDTAERAIALMQQYNSKMTADEEQKQLCLRLVAEHRKQLPGTPTKSSLMML